MLRAIACAALACVSSVTAIAACPTDVEPRASGVVLTVQVAAAAPLALDAAELAKLPATSLTQRQLVSSGASAASAASAGSAGSAGSERSIVYGGVLLRDVLARAGFGGASDRGARTGVVEAVASDGYRAVFSWGELFNANAGEQALVILTQDGRPLDAYAGPLALRSLGDVRPGPRHVRNLCALLVRR